MTNEQDLAQMAFRLGVTVAVHPVEYAKILIQIGFEPISPRPTYTLLGRPALALPNVFEYIGYVRRKRGFFGLYHGTLPRVLGTLTSEYVFNRVVKACPLPNEVSKNEDEENNKPAELREDEVVLVFFQQTTRNMIARCAAIIACQPFQVITVRMVAQFVGGETTYRGLFSSIREIYKQDGLSGFFSGLVPCILGELLALWISSCLTFVVNTYLIKDKDLQTYTGASMSFIASAVTYPFILVSKVMTVNNSGLIAGKPPHMPYYTGWTDCWAHLKAHNQLKRGSSLLWRYYTGPYILRDGKPQIISSRQFQTPSATKFK